MSQIQYTKSVKSVKSLKHDDDGIVKIVEIGEDDMYVVHAPEGSCAAYVVDWIQSRFASGRREHKGECEFVFWDTRHSGKLIITLMSRNKRFRKQFVRKIIKETPGSYS